jgi:hypothetical protein
VLCGANLAMADSSAAASASYSSIRRTSLRGELDIEGEGEA